jgi:UDP-N-acetylglucosamine 4,6-dehydratase
MNEVASFLENKDILVTGGCGSIGSAIVEQLLNYNVKRIRVFDNNESAQFHLHEKFTTYGKVRGLIGDIRDRERLKRAMKGVNIVFHCAALKHVPLCEYNPFEAVATNVYGTENVIDAAREEGVDKFMAISTDKAVSPINTMGATKLLSEKLVMTAPVGEVKTLFSCVRLGNVANSSGSVVPAFIEQIKNGGPVKVTSKDMVRFFMTMSEAVNLILINTLRMKGREIFILKMKALRVMDLAEVMVEELASKYRYEQKDIEIKITGIRPGERLYELLMTEEEAEYAADEGNEFVLRPGLYTPHYISEVAVARPINPRYYDVRKADLLTKNEIGEMLRGEKIL